jgi:hypothetical protein
MSTKTLDDNTEACHPGGLTISYEKLRVLHPELDSPAAWRRFVAKHPIYPKRHFWRTRVEEQLLYGDSRAAVVVSIDPHLIAAYTDELDCVALLRFPESFVEDYDLEIGSRLLSVNTYFYPGECHVEDLQVGPNAYGRYVNFNPFIADFLTDDVATLEERKAGISEDEWHKTAELGSSYLSERIAPPRDGRPLLSSLPAKSRAGSSNVQFSVSEILDRLFGLMVFVIGTTWSVKTIAIDPKAGWGGTIIFGAASVLMVVEIVKICSADEAPPVEVKPKQRFRRALVQAGTIIVSIFLGLSEVFISHWLHNSTLALWFAAFVTTLAFYPLRDEHEKSLRSFRLWAIYCAVLAVFSVILSYVSEGLQTAVLGR